MKYRARLSARQCLQAVIAGSALWVIVGCESSMFTRSYAEPPMNRQYMELYRTSEMMDRPPPHIYQYPRPPVS